MDRILESRLFVGQEVTFDDAGTSRLGFVERIDDSQAPAMVTVRPIEGALWRRVGGGCSGCRITRPESAFEPSSKVERMVPPRGGITRAS